MIRSANPRIFSLISVLCSFCSRTFATPCLPFPRSRRCGHAEMICDWQRIAPAGHRPAGAPLFCLWLVLWSTPRPQILSKIKPLFSFEKSGFIGAAGRIRTADLILTKDALYRLSYSSILAAYAAFYIKRYLTFSSLKWRPRTGSNRRPPA